MPLSTSLMPTAWPALDSGAGRARALRSAALAVMRVPEYRHPYYWAGFVEVGDGY
jgi:CHAT domain-containing protein